MINNKTAAILLLSVSILSCLNLVGCKDPAVNSKPDFALVAPPKLSEEELAKKEIREFKEMVAHNLEVLEDEAKANPDQTGWAVVSLKDYFLLTTLEDFNKKYPELTIVETNHMLFGGATSSVLDTKKPLHDEIERLIRYWNKYAEWNMRDRLSLRKDRFSQETIDRAAEEATKILEVAKARKVRTMGFAVEGKLKDILAMAKAELGKDYVRAVASINKRQDGTLPFFGWDPIYAYEGTNLPDARR